MSGTLAQQLAAFVTECRRRGIKATHQRREIYRELARTREHPDVQTIYLRVRRRMPAVSLDTVYRTLRLLGDRRIISRVSCLDGRTRYDAATAAHHHFTCLKCGEIKDLYSESLNGVSVPAEASVLGTVESVHVELRGICAACQRRDGRRVARAADREPVTG